MKPAQQTTATESYGLGRVSDPLHQVLLLAYLRGAVLTIQLVIHQFMKNTHVPFAAERKDLVDLVYEAGEREVKDIARLAE